MKKPLKNEKIIKPINQLKLFGYKHYFDSFTKLYKRRKLSNIILLSGQKGIGKATFAFHFINFLLSTNENNKYLVDELKINQNNFSYNHVVKGIHPNFFFIVGVIPHSSSISRLRAPFNDSPFSTFPPGNSQRPPSIELSFRFCI